MPNTGLPIGVPLAALGLICAAMVAARRVRD
jgi:hypothetical protein